MPTREDIQASDENALRIAKAAGWDETKRRDVWKTRWSISSDLQREFVSVESYVGFMEGTARGCIKFHGPRQRAGAR